MERNNDFNQKMRNRTFSFSVSIVTLLKAKKITLFNRSAINQLLRSSSSVAANFRAAARARSDPEFFAKICIVTEECDETQFWLNFLTDSELIDESEVAIIKNECEEILKIVSTMRKNAKEKIAETKNKNKNG